MSEVGSAWPAGHSPAAAPLAALPLAAVIASRRVQAPSLAAVSATELTLIVVADASCAEPAKTKPVSSVARVSRPLRSPPVRTFRDPCIGKPRTGRAYSGHGAASTPI